KLRDDLEDTARCADSEIIWFVVWYTAAPSQQLSNLIHEFAKLIGLGFHIDGYVLDFRVVALKSIKRHYELAVFDWVATEEASGRLLHHADYGVNLAVNFDLTAQWFKRAKQGFGDCRSYHRDLRAVFLFGLRKEPSGFDVDVSNLVVIRPDAEDQRTVCFYSPALYDWLIPSRGERANYQRGAYAFRGRQFADRVGIFDCQILSGTLGLGWPAEADSNVVPLCDKDDIGSKPLGLIENKFFEAGQEGGDGNYSHCPADHAEHSQGGTHLVGAKRVKSHQYVFADFLKMHSEDQFEI